MLTTKIMLNKAVITSGFTLEQIKLVEKYQPEELRVYKTETSELLFKMATGNIGALSTYGIVFNTSNSEGKAALMIDVEGETAEEKKAYIVDHYGVSIDNANMIERHLQDIIDSITAKKEAVAASITISE